MNMKKFIAVVALIAIGLTGSHYVPIWIDWSLVQKCVDDNSRKYPEVIELIKIECEIAMIETRAERRRNK